VASEEGNKKNRVEKIRKRENRKKKSEKKGNINS
jgi:hypothetical protein